MVCTSYKKTIQCAKHFIIWGMGQGGRVVLVVIIWDGWGGERCDAKEREIDLQISHLQRLTSLYQIDSPLTVHTDKKRL